jgi:hypothetical protein
MDTNTLLFNSYDYEAYKLDYEIINANGKNATSLIINIKCGFIATTFRINNPNKYGVEMWQHLRNSKTGESRYDGARIEKKGYNITMLFSENYASNPASYHYIKSIDGIMELGIKTNYIDSQMYSSSISIPIELFYNILDKIIIDLSKM